MLKPYPGKPRRRALNEIFDEIADDYLAAPPHQAERITALCVLDGLEDNYYGQPASELVREFLDAAATWHTENSLRIKQELNNMLRGRA